MPQEQAQKRDYMSKKKRQLDEFLEEIKRHVDERAPVPAA